MEHGEHNDYRYGTRRLRKEDLSIPNRIISRRQVKPPEEKKQKKKGGRRRRSKEGRKKKNKKKIFAVSLTWMFAGVQSLTALLGNSKEASAEHMDTLEVCSLLDHSCSLSLTRCFCFFFCFFFFNRSRKTRKRRRSVTSCTSRRPEAGLTAICSTCPSPRCEKRFFVIFLLLTALFQTQALKTLPSGSAQRTALISALHDSTTPYTTRPKRANEQDGREYHFVDVATFDAMLSVRRTRRRRRRRRRRITAR